MSYYYLPNAPLLGLWSSTKIWYPKFGTLIKKCGRFPSLGTKFFFGPSPTIWDVGVLRNCAVLLIERRPMLWRWMPVLMVLTPTICETLPRLRFKVEQQSRRQSLYRVRGGDSGKVADISSYFNFAEARKDEADASHHRGDFEAALKNYKLAIAQCETWLSGESDSAVDEKHTFCTESKVTSDGIVALLYRCRLNSALCCLKWGQPEETIKQCTALLQAKKSGRKIASIVFLHRAFLLRARALRRTGRFQEALIDIERTEKLAEVLLCSNTLLPSNSETHIGINGSPLSCGKQRNNDLCGDHMSFSVQAHCTTASQLRLALEQELRRDCDDWDTEYSMQKSEAIDQSKRKFKPARPLLSLSQDEELPTLLPAVSQLLRSGDVKAARHSSCKAFHENEFVMDALGTCKATGGDLKCQSFHRVKGTTSSDNTLFGSLNRGVIAALGKRNVTDVSTSSLIFDILNKIKKPETSALLASLAASATPEVLTRILNLEHTRAEKLSKFLQSLTVKRIANYATFIEGTVLLYRQVQKCLKLWVRYSDLRVCLMLVLWMRGFSLIP